MCLKISRVQIRLLALGFVRLLAYFPTIIWLETSLHLLAKYRQLHLFELTHVYLWQRLPDLRKFYLKNKVFAKSVHKMLISPQVAQLSIHFLRKISSVVPSRGTR